jgi:hypothetical protein
MTYEEKLEKKGIQIVPSKVPTGSLNVLSPLGGRPPLNADFIEDPV